MEPTKVHSVALQVLRDYAAFADPQLGRWQRRADGSLSPSARSMTMPLLQLFHGEPGGKVWKNAVDASLRTATSVAQVRRTSDCCGGGCFETCMCHPDGSCPAHDQLLRRGQNRWLCLSFQVLFCRGHECKGKGWLDL